MSFIPAQKIITFFVKYLRDSNTLDGIWNNFFFYKMLHNDIQHLYNCIDVIFSLAEQRKKKQEKTKIILATRPSLLTLGGAL